MLSLALLSIESVWGCAVTHWRVHLNPSGIWALLCFWGAGEVLGRFERDSISSLGSRFRLRNQL